VTNNTVMTLAALRKAAADGKALSAAQYDSALATVANGRLATVLVAYAVRQRGIAGTADAGTASLTRLAADTLPNGRSEAAWRSTLSKYATAYGYAVTAGVADAVDAGIADLLVRGYDSTADGRKALAEAATAAAGKADALAILTAAAEAAVASKAAARKAGEAGKADDDKAAAGKARTDDGSKAAASAVPLSWAQTLAILASTAPAEAAALDADALAVATNLVASIADALADASATVAAALATARSKKK
jgi:hypothetical protein